MRRARRNGERSSADVLSLRCGQGHRCTDTEVYTRTEGYRNSAMDLYCMHVVLMVATLVDSWTADACEP